MRLGFGPDETSIADILRQVPDGWHDVKDKGGRLLCRFHPGRDLLHFRYGSKEAIVDLSRYRKQG
jgi:hypothetical protein